MRLVPRVRQGRPVFELNLKGVGESEVTNVERAMTAPSQPATAQSRFALSIGGKIYGPYAVPQMRTYIAEGRVTVTSLVSRDGGPWVPAADEPFCAEVFAETAERMAARPERAAEAGDAAGAGAARQPAAPLSAREAFLKELEGVRAFKSFDPPPAKAGPPRPADPELAPLIAPTRTDQPETSNLAIIFDLKSRGHSKLEEDIMSLGAAVRVLPGFWLLNAPMTSGSVRNRLTKHFGAIDTFFIIDASRDKLAWFNLGPEIDSHIRKVWRRS